MGLRAYADHRKERGLPGASLRAVQQALIASRIARTCEKHARCPAPGCSTGWLEPSRCDIDWLQNTQIRVTDHGPGRGSPMVEAPTQDPEHGMVDVPDMLTSRAKREYFAANTAELVYAKTKGELGNVEEMYAALHAWARAIRGNLVNLPRRLSGQLADMTDRHEISALLEDELRRAIDDVKEPARV